MMLRSKTSRLWQMLSKSNIAFHTHYKTTPTPIIAAVNTQTGSSLCPSDDQRPAVGHPCLLPNGRTRDKTHEEDAFGRSSPSPDLRNSERAVGMVRGTAAFRQRLRLPQLHALFLQSRIQSFVFILTMSVFSVEPRDGTPVTAQVLDEVCASLRIRIKDDEKEDYRKLLAVFHESAEELMAMPDYEPETDLQRYPRENVHFPEKADNEYGAWAWKVHIEDKAPRREKGLLNGKTVALKDNISVKDVPMLLGTAFVKGYVPVCGRSPS